jgi:hypothetical protein
LAQALQFQSCGIRKTNFFTDKNHYPLQGGIRMKKFVKLTLGMAVLASTIGCTNKNPIGPASSSLTLPATASMTIPSFGGQQGLGKTAATSTHFAFTMAYTAVSYWTGNVELALMQPRALFEICQTAQPTPLPDNSGWVWTVSDTKGFSATLTGRVENDIAQWSMSVTGGNLTNFVWFTGVSTITGRSGTWTFYDTTTVNGVNPAVIQFAYTLSDAQKTVKVSVVNTTSPDYGSFLQWSGAGADKSFEAYDAKTAGHVLISWNETTEAGSIANVVTGQHYCWDTRANGHGDIACQ